MKILGIETSCDETAVALLDGDTVAGSLVYSQIKDHEVHGGVVPELAARKHLEKLPVLFDELCRQTGLKIHELAAIGVTSGPGLIGCLHVGVNFAKALSFAAGIPLYAVNHLEGHLASVELVPGAPRPPFIALLVSGGHTSLYAVLPEGHRLMGSTRDDAAGEAFDKGAKLLGLGYPGGPAVDRTAQGGDPARYPLPVPRIQGHPYDFSFSGVKTALLYRVREETSTSGGALDGQQVQDFSASLQKTVVDTLLGRCRLAADEFGIPDVVIVGGVAANSYLRSEAVRLRHLRFCFPPPAYCTDNAAMIARVALNRRRRGEPPDGLEASPKARWPVADTLPADSPIPRREKPRTGR